MFKHLFILLLFSLTACNSTLQTTTAPYISKAPEKPSSPAKLNSELVVQLGHTQPINRVIYAANGLFIASSTNSGEIKLWSTDGQLIRTFKQFKTSDFKITADSKHLLIGHGYGKMTLVSVLGKRVVNFPRLNGSMGDVAISPDNKRVIGCNRSNKNKLCIISTLEGREVNRFKVPSKRNDATNLIFSADSQYIFANLYNTIYKWDNNGTFIKKYKAADSSIFSLDISADGKQLLTTTYSDHKNFRNKNRKISLWTLNGKLITSFTTPGGTDTKFSPDSRHILTGSNKKKAYIYSLTGKLVRQIKSGFNSTSSPHSLAISPDGNKIITANHLLNPPGMYIWSFKGKKLRTFNQFSTSIQDIALLHGGRAIATVSSDRYVRIWSVTGRLIKRFYAGDHWISRILIAPNQKVLVTAGKNLDIWTLNGKKLSSIRVSKKSIRDLKFTPDGKKLITVDGNGYISINTLDKKTKSLRFKGHNGKAISSLAISPDGKLFATGSIWERFTIWNMKGKKVSSFKMPKGTKPPFSSIHAMTFTPDSKQLITVNTRRGREVRFYDLNAKLLHQMNVANINIGDITISPSGKYLAITNLHNIGIWDLQSKRLLKVLKGHNDYVRKISFAENENLLISASSDTTMRLWNINSGHSFAMLANKDQWLIFSDDGLFDASKYGSNMISMVDGMKHYGVDQFAVYLNRPDLLYKRIGIGSEALIQHLNTRFQHRLKRTNLNKDATLQSLHAPEVSITRHHTKGKHIFLELAFNDKDGLRSYQVYVNDVPVYQKTGKAISGTVSKIKDKIELSYGDNKIEVAAFNQNGVESLRSNVRARYTKRTRSNLYYIGMGVSKYKNTKLDLKYAHKDVLDLQQHFKRYKKSFNNIKTMVLTDHQVTRDNIQKVHQFLKSAKVDDVVILSLSGHGAYEVGDYSGYYYLSHEADVDRLAETAIAYDELEEIMSNIAARRKLMLVDTCASGEVDSATLQRIKTFAKENDLDTKTSSALVTKTKYQSARPYLYMKDRYIYNDLNRRNGAIVFTSTEGGEIAFEHKSIKNGFFTHAIINALNSAKSDLNQDGKISMLELENTVRLNVSRKTQRLQNPIIERDNIHQTFNLPVIK